MNAKKAKKNMNFSDVPSIDKNWDNKRKINKKQFGIFLLIKPGKYK